MPETPTAILEKYFASLPDPRVERTRDHKLLDIVIIAICTVIGGAEGWTDVEGRADEIRLAEALLGTAERYSVTRHPGAGLCALGPDRV